MSTARIRALEATFAAVLVMATLSIVYAQTPAGPMPPLVPCETAPAGAPCSQVATSAADLVGVWQQFMWNPRLATNGGMGYIRYLADGTYHLADTVEHTAGPYTNFPYGKVTFAGDEMTIIVDSETPLAECGRPSLYRVHVLKAGDTPVALWYQVIDDTCTGRVADLSQPLLWVAD